ncbi:MAG: DUF1553 domain-containing protein [bacterium]|nr:DUF1553 domain-containing protein [bacterium]
MANNSSIRSLLCLICLVPLGIAGAQEDRSYTLEFDHQEIPPALRGQDSRWQLLVSKRMHDGNLHDATRTVEYRVEPPIADIDQHGFLRPVRDGQAVVIASDKNGHVAKLSLNISDMNSQPAVNFPNQIIPLFTKFGCNGGGCHGKAAGQAGFKLSLLGFEPRVDYEHLLLESRGRRLFPAVPDKSLLLQKATNESPHGGGKRLSADSQEYDLLKRWIAMGMPYGSSDDPLVTHIEVTPSARQLSRESQQQLSVIAHYSDGHREDITRTAQYESNNTDLAQVDERGLVTLRDSTGDVAVMVRYQGQVAVFRASIPLGLDISEIAAWPPARNMIDELIFSKLRELEIPPSQTCDDGTFIRRVTLDLTGRLPTAEETRSFLTDQNADKHALLIDRLLESSDHADYFARKWITILRNRRDSSGKQLGSFAFHAWLRQAFLENVPYDVLVRQLLTASGSIATNPPVTWWREVATTESRVEDAAQLFLGQRLQCARCHHHPFEKWSQQDYYQMAAFFSKVQRKEGDVPEEPVFVSRVGAATARHPKSGQALQPAGLDAAPPDLAAHQDPRHALVDWMCAADNPFFARSLVNRYWKHFFAVGMVEPEDDLRVTNPPSHPELLEALAKYFVENKYDTRQLLRLICNSSTYRLSSEPNEYNLADTHSYSRYYPKRLGAEVLLDAIDQMTMTRSDFAGMPVDTRAVSLPDTGFSSYFLDVFGQPSSTTACECERSNEATLAQSLHLLNSVEVQGKLASQTGWAAAAAVSSQSNSELIEQLYLSALSRQPTPNELLAAREFLDSNATDRQAAWEDLLWAVMNTKEFLFNH